MSAKLRIKAKGIEIEWEGDAEFLKSELPDLIASIIEAIGDGSSEELQENSGGESNASGDPSSSIKFTTASAAAKLQVRSGPELFKVALLKLQMSDGVEPAARAQIHSEMKMAHRVYKPSMRTNLSHTITKLLGQGEVNEPSTGKYSLSHSAYEQLAERIRQ